MKKWLCILFTALFVTACRQEAPAEYSYYENFVPGKMGVEITPVPTENYNDITDDGNKPVLADKLGLENLTDHRVYTTKDRAVVNFYFSYYVTHREVETALEYGYKTFWLGEMNTADLLPYQDWQYSHKIKELVVQIFRENVAVVQEKYVFDQLTDSGEKLAEKTRAVNNDVLLPGTYIYLGDWLKGSDEQLAAYTDIESVAGLTVHTAMRQTPDKTRLIVELLTEERQIAPEKLNEVYDAVYERCSFINENMVVQLYVADKGMYFEYTGHVKLPQSE